MKTTERDLQEACARILEFDGWRRLRTDPVSDLATVNTIRRAILGSPALNHVRELILSVIKRCLRGKGFGEKGMADDLFIRYERTCPKHIDRACFEAAGADVLWIEWKSPRGKVAAHQRDWHMLERKRGALTLIAGEDFPASVDGFKNWYKASGLNGNVV